MSYLHNATLAFYENAAKRFSCFVSFPGTLLNNAVMLKCDCDTEQTCSCISSSSHRFMRIVVCADHDPGKPYGRLQLRVFKCWTRIEPLQADAVDSQSSHGRPLLRQASWRTFERYCQNGKTRRATPWMQQILKLVIWDHTLQKICCLQNGHTVEEEQDATHINYGT